MSLIAVLEGCKDVAMAARAEAAHAAAQDVVEFEEHGTDIAAAFDEEELAACEEALRLGLQLDEREDEESSEREQADAALASRILRVDEDTDAACAKDDQIARELEATLQAEMARVAKLEKRSRTLAQRKMCKGDLALAEQLAADIEAEESSLRDLERKDRRLAQKLVKEEGKALETLPQTEEKLRTLSRSINGDGPVPMRTRLRVKLAAVRKGLSEITNTKETATAV